LAKKRRVNLYQRVRNLGDCKVVLANRDPVVAAFEITNQWFGATSGEIALPSSNDVIIGSHGICLLRADEEKQRLVFVNSWGEEWGDRGIGYLPFSYFDKWIVSAWTTPTVSRQDQVTDFVQYLCLGYFTVLGDVVHVREIYDSQRDERLAWTIAVERPPFLEVEDCFVRPMHRGRGYGRELFEMLRKLGAERNLQLRVWLSHADDDGPIQQRLCASLGLEIGPSGVRWARYLATNEDVCSHPITDIAKPLLWSPPQGT
jgi:GNAT superfamily N-acetyltransferase